MSAPSARNQGWNDYWKEDRIASCVPENEATAREIDEHWIARFADLPNGCRVLDVATGNGVLLAHAAVAAERGGRRYALTGVDLADIDPLRYVADHPAALRDATFKGGVAAEKLPFPVASFDLVVSQYGLEYADLAIALREVARVLVPGGRLLWLAHSEGSAVVLHNRDQGRQVEFLLAPAGPLSAMGKLVEKISRRKGLQHAAGKLRAALTDAEAYCRDHPPAMIVREVCTVLAEAAQRWQAYDPGDLQTMLADSRTRLIRHRQRINDLLAAVLSDARQDLVRATLRDAEMGDIAFETLRVGSTDSPIGILIEARYKD